MGKKALIITSNAGVEHDELIQPLEFLKGKGIEVIHAAESFDAVQTVKGDKALGPSYTPQASLDQVSVEDYDILIIPGGTVNADTLRLNGKSPCHNSIFYRSKQADCRNLSCALDTHQCRTD